VQKRGLWPPKGGREYPVLDTDDWWKIAAREHIDAWALIEFNFQTHVPEPEEVNWYLRELVGCRHSKDGGRNYAFLGADPKRRKIYLPPVPPPPAPLPIPIPWPDQLKKLQYEVEHSNDPQKERFLPSSLAEAGTYTSTAYSVGTRIDPGVTIYCQHDLVEPFHDDGGATPRHNKKSLVGEFSFPPSDISVFEDNSVVIVMSSATTPYNRP
jgi:hypothetical protein